MLQISGGVPSSANLFVYIFLEKPMSLQASDFRQHCIPSPLFVLRGERHWLLDWGPSRDVLKAFLRRQSPHGGVPIFARGSEFDFELDQLIDVIGLRHLARPASVVQHYRLAFLFLKLLVRVELYLSQPAIPSKGI